MGQVIASAAMSLDGFVADTGVRFFGDYAGSPALLDNPQVVQGDRVTHLHYRVRKP